ncbi:hypothetical protein [Micromonospora humidisoli]|uniref:Uncharacterized protein n=2 Tax=Micromonospora TaxID=1873 RepID=A0ABS2JKC7_9ACTN|nr:hypothetical protein [Micromonospora humidisoli]MBM7086945.1 hypothetical protein [Micromonospora humidisoli]
MTTPSTDLIFAPVGIAHLTNRNSDLLRAAAAGRSALRVTTAAQLNGVPHFGTTVTILTVFAFAAHAADDLGLPATVVFDALENAPAEHLERGGEQYTRTVGDLIDAGRLNEATRTDGFRRLLDWARDRSGVPYEVRPYAVYQNLRPVRECLHHIAQQLDAFAPICAPTDGVVKVRPRCPACRLMEKAGKHLRITTLPDAVQLDSICPDHGPYTEHVPVNGGGWYDANTPVRSIQKGYLLAAERELYDACSVSVDGADWGGAWHSQVLAPGLATLGVPPHDWPVSVFTPLVVDRTGGKLSKSLYVAKSAYADLPELFLNLDILLAEHGDHVLDTLWTEVSRWASDPHRLHRSYTVDYFAALLNEHLPARPAPRAA